MSKKKICPLCKREVPEEMYEMHVTTDRLVIEKMKRDFPDWTPEEGACEPCLKRYEALRAA